MDGDLTPSPSAPESASKRVLHRLLAVAENRVLLLLAEIEEERDRFLVRIVLALGAAVLALLGLMAWTAAIVLLLWPVSQVATLLILGAVYLIAAGVIGRKLFNPRQHPPPLTATLDQLRKDRACLK